jgi:hypothetical protein
MATTAAPAPDAQASIGTFGRLTGALFNPKQTFVDIAQRPTWIAPVVLFCLLNVAVTAIFTQRVGWRSFMEKRFENNSNFQQLPPEQREQRLNQAVKMAPIFGYVFGVIGIPVVILVVAGVLLGAFNLLAGAGLNFKTSLGIVSYAYMPGVLGGLLGILVLFLKDPSTIDLENLVASNFAALLTSDTSKGLIALAKSFDLFVFWILFLLAVGFSAANPKKITMGKALGIVVGLWLAFVIVRVGLAFIF